MTEQEQNSGAAETKESRIMKRFNPHPKKFFVNRFTDEQRQEIYATRARLEAYRNKIQPYTIDEVASYPVLIESPQKATPRDIVTQLQSEVKGWRQKHAEMMNDLDQLKKRKLQSKYD